MRILECSTQKDRESAVALAASALRRHQLVVFATDTAYAVACDAFSFEGVERLNEAKDRRSGDALPVMIGSIATLDGIVTGLDPDAREFVRGFWPGPLTAICRSQPSLNWDLGGDGETVAVRMPLHPVALDLLREVGPLAVIAANRAGGEIPLTCHDAVAALGSDSLSFALDAGTCEPGQASSIVDLTVSPPRLLREGAFAVDVLKASLPTLQVD